MLIPIVWRDGWGLLCECSERVGYPSLDCQSRECLPPPASGLWGEHRLNADQHQVQSLSLLSLCATLLCLSEIDVFTWHHTHAGCSHLLILCVTHTQKNTQQLMQLIPSELIVSWLTRFNLFFSGFFLFYFFFVRRFTDKLLACNQLSVCFTV